MHIIQFAFFTIDLLVKNRSIMFYRVISWIDEKIQAGGKVLVHCREGVSRSCTCAMVYLIWRYILCFGRAVFLHILFV